MKYVSLIYDIDEWYELLKTKKSVIQNVFSCLEEKNIELNDNQQMFAIYMGIYTGLTAQQIMLYVQPKFKVHVWKSLREALALGVSIERLKPLVDEEKFDWVKFKEIKSQYFIELLYSKDDKTEM